ncbi:hypothetical protein F5884DRAFT_851200 [Xylogone sp. PMI_703]|nr:hypothetical protein F5884DRAFT_851200 [Xylogone sp. PMI_703]
MPVVFAMQNPAVTQYLDLAIQWSLFRIEGRNLSGVGAAIISATSYFPGSVSGPHYRFGPLYNLTTQEGSWLLEWTLSSINCSQFPPNGHVPGYDQVNKVTFTTKNGAPAADLVAATADNVCAGAESFLFNATEIEVVSVGDRTNEVTTCVAVAPMSITPSPTPCAAQLNATGASAISSALTFSYCSLPSSPVKCAVKSTGSREGQLGGSVWIVVAFGWLMWVLG